jgi:hypothetical protein
MSKTGIKVFILLLLTFFKAGAGTLSRNGFIRYSLNAHFGAMVPHNDQLASLKQENLRSIEMVLWFDHSINHPQKNPVLGLGYIFSNLGNTDVLGNMHAVCFGLMSPRLYNTLPVQYKIGLGVAYATKRYRPDDGFMNPAIGSHLNAYGQLTLAGRIPVFGSRWILRPGMSFHHLSNGTIVAPNQGLNLMTVHVGLEFQSGHTHRGVLNIDRKKLVHERNRFLIMYAPGIKQVHSSIDHKIFTSSLIFDYSYEYLAESSIGIGVNLYYNDTWAHYPYNLSTPDQPPSPFQSSVHLSLEQDLGPISFILHPAIYTLKPSSETPWFTNRLGVKYSFRNNFSVQFSIKHHWFALADYFEWGIGYEIRW